MIYDLKKISVHPSLELSQKAEMTIVLNDIDSRMVLSYNMLLPILHCFNIRKSAMP